MENLQKVKQMLDYLNAQDLQQNFITGVKQGGWIAQDNYFAVTKFEFGKDGKEPLFTPTFGIPMKVFTNLRTGEIKMFIADLFEG